MSSKSVIQAVDKSYYLYPTGMFDDPPKSAHQRTEGSSSSGQGISCIDCCFKCCPGVATGITILAAPLVLTGLAISTGREWRANAKEYAKVKDDQSTEGKAKAALLKGMTMERKLTCFALILGAVGAALVFAGIIGFVVELVKTHQFNETFLAAMDATGIAVGIVGASLYHKRHEMISAYEGCDPDSRRRYYQQLGGTLPPANPQTT